MKKYLRPVEKLDEVLGCVAFDPKTMSHLYKNFFEIAALLDKKEVAYYPDELNMILDRLIDDGCIELKEAQATFQDILPYSTKNYALRFNGLLLMEQGGYKQRELDKKRERRNLNWVNGAVAIGTAFAGLYGVIEIVKWIITLCNSR